MPQTHKISATYVDTCFVDYLTDHDERIVGALLGSSIDETAEYLADEIYGTEDFPLGDTVYDALKRAIRDAINGLDLRPVDANGNRVTPGSDDANDEQSSVWVKIVVESKPLRIALDNQGSGHEQDGTVLVTCDDRDAAADDGYIDGSSWETPRDMNEAYTSVMDRPTLVEDLTAQGYDVDCSCYSAPEPADMARWAQWDGSYRSIL